MANLVTLSVGTDTPEQLKAVYSLLSDISGEMSVDYHYSSVTSVDTDRLNDGTEEFHDAETMNRVREAIKDAIELRVSTAPDAMVVDIIKALEFAGIVFRERRAV